jgi:hypothetical protein
VREKIRYMNEAKMLGKKEKKIKIRPISGHSPSFFKFIPDGNLTLENEDMSRKMRTYGNPSDA